MHIAGRHVSSDTGARFIKLTRVKSEWLKYKMLLATAQEISPNALYYYLQIRADKFVYFFSSWVLQPEK